jgi:hypothetical protein
MKMDLFLPINYKRIVWHCVENYYSAIVAFRKF